MSEHILPDFEHVDFVRVPPRRSEDSKSTLNQLKIAEVKSISDEEDLNQMDLKVKMNKLTKETVLLRKEISDLKEVIMEQNKTIMNMISEQHTMITRIYKTEAKPACVYTGRFPIQSQEEMDALEADIDDRNKEPLIATVQRMLMPGGLLKNTASIFSVDVILAYNVDGVHYKKRLQDYPKIIDLLFKATMREGLTHRQFLDDLRKGLKNVKNRHFKNVCMQRKKLKLQNLAKSAMLEMDASDLLEIDQSEMLEMKIDESDDFE